MQAAKQTKGTVFGTQVATGLITRVSSLEDSVEEKVG